MAGKSLLMTNYKKWLGYLGVYIAGLLTAYLVFIISGRLSPTSPQKKTNTISLMPAPKIKSKSADMNDLIAKMQSNFRSASDDDLNEDLMAQFHEMRNKMLQLLQEESATPNQVFGNLEDRPETNIESREDDKNYYFDIDLGSVDQNSLKMDIKDGHLYVTGEMKKESKEESSLGVSSSMVISSFSKTVPIPSDANPKKAKIEQHDSILTITLPKRHL